MFKGARCRHRVFNRSFPEIYCTDEVFRKTLIASARAGLQECVRRARAAVALRRGSGPVAKVETVSAGARGAADSSAAGGRDEPPADGKGTGKTAGGAKPRASARAENAGFAGRAEDAKERSRTATTEGGPGAADSRGTFFSLF